jgi:hypothetical protein
MPLSDKGSDIGIIVARGDMVNVDVVNRLATTLSPAIARSLSDSAQASTPAEA